MKDALLGLLMIVTLAFGYYVVVSFDRFMDQIYKKTYHRM